MAKIKGYTNLEQSKKLAEILPFQSADMAYYQWKGDGYLMSPNPFVLDGTEEKENGVFEYVPCWSLASLFDVLENEIDGEEGEAYLLNIEKEGAWWNVDACYELIVKLHESNLL